MIERALAKHLNSKKAFRNLVGANGIFRGRIPASHTGNIAVVLRRSGADRFNDLYGEAAAVPVSVQMDIVGRATNAGYTVREVAEVVRNLVSGYRGMFHDVYVHGCTIENEIDFEYPPSDGTDDWAYQFTYEFKITHTQPQPKLA